MKNLNSNQYMSTIQIHRGIAAILIIIFHTSQAFDNIFFNVFFDWAYVGVDIFLL